MSLPDLSFSRTVPILIVLAAVTSFNGTKEPVELIVTTSPSLTEGAEECSNLTLSSLSFN